MLLNIRGLSNKKYVVDADPKETILQFKTKIHDQHLPELPTEHIRLIYSGKILADANTVESYKFEETGFIALLATKPKAAPAPPSTPGPSKTVKPSGTPAAPLATGQSRFLNANHPATPSPAASGAAIQQAGSLNAATSMTSGFEENLSALLDMGFENDRMNKRALRKAFNHLERAIEYLAEPTADLLQDEPEPNAAPPVTTATRSQPMPSTSTSVPSTTAASAASTAAIAPGPEADDIPVNLFDAAAQAAQTNQQSAGDQTLNSLAALFPQGLNSDVLRGVPNFQQLRQLVQQQPAMIPLLQSIVQANPQLQRFANMQDNAGFMDELSNESPNDAPLPPGAQSISVTAEERDAIKRLSDMGFSQHEAAEAYFACDKNETLAANFLLEEFDEDDEQQNVNQSANQ